MLSSHFRVPLEKSEFRLHNRGAEGFVAYRGSFSAYANTYDVVDLEIEGQDIPSRLQMAQAKDRIEYARIRFSDSDYLLPKASQTTLSDIKGAFSQNSAVFYDCHEYRADSTVAFGERRPEANIATVEPKALPPGILLTLRTTVPIERGVTAIGDTVSAVLTRQIDNPVIPRGAVASLRIVRMQPYQLGNRDYRLGSSC